MDTARTVCDVAVVGGGILGQSIALECTRRQLNVTLIYPRDHWPDSATLAAGAMIGAFGELEADLDGFSRQRLEFRIRAQDMYRSWLEQLRNDSGQDVSSTSGMFMIANNGDPGDCARLTQIKDQLDAHNRRNSWIDPLEIPCLQPHMGHRAQAALFIDDDLTVDSADMLRVLSLALRNSGRCEVVHDRVTGLDPLGDGWILRTRHSGEFCTPHTVVCAGAQTPAVLGEGILPSLRLPTLFFAKGIGVTVSGASAFPHAIRTPNRSSACGLHVVPRRNGRLYVGASNHWGYATAAAKGVTPGEITAILGNTIREISAPLRDATIEKVRMGLRPVSADDTPIIGRTRLPGLFLATGTFRTGIVMAPLIAETVRKEITGEIREGENPFRATDDRNARQDCHPDGGLNIAILYANRGLHLYNRLRETGSARYRHQALAAWRTYTRLAGVRSDRRIVALMQELEGEG